MDYTLQQTFFSLPISPYTKQGAPGTKVVLLAEWGTIASTATNSLQLSSFTKDMRSLRLSGHTKQILDVAIHPSGEPIATASADSTVRFWTHSIKPQSYSLKGHVKSIRALSFTPDGNAIITGSDDKTCKFWGWPEYEFLSSYLGHTNWIRSVACSPKQFISLADDKSIRLWDYTRDGATTIYSVPMGSKIRWHPAHNALGGVYSDGSIRIHDTRVAKVVQLYEGAHTGAALGFSFHPAGIYAASVGEDAACTLWDLRRGKPLFSLVAENPLCDVDFGKGAKPINKGVWRGVSEGEKWMVTASVTGAVALWSEHDEKLSFKQRK